MTLQELGVEYREQASAIQSSIDKLRPLLRLYHGDELLALKRQLLILYDMSRDCKKISTYLQQYYSEN